MRREKLDEKRVITIWWWVCVVSSGIYWRVQCFVGISKKVHTGKKGEQYSHIFVSKHSAVSVNFESRIREVGGTVMVII